MSNTVLIDSAGPETEEERKESAREKRKRKGKRFAVERVCMIVTCLKG